MLGSQSAVRTVVEELEVGHDAYSIYTQFVLHSLYTLGSYKLYKPDSS